MRYYIITGEASGDLHASNLMKAIRGNEADAVFRCWGGDLMAAQGGEVVRHYRDLAFMGFAEVVMHLPEILNNLNSANRIYSPLNRTQLFSSIIPGLTSEWPNLRTKQA
jgi:lipid-A-disaccharide synthase